jgi:hypothetical protein
MKTRFLHLLSYRKDEPGNALCSFADRPLSIACVLVKTGTTFNCSAENIRCS